MIQTGQWQNDAVSDLVTLLEPNQTVRALILFGSYAQDQNERDVWSDVDVLIVTADAVLERFYPATDWLGSFGELFAIDQSANRFWKTTRACFTDMRRIDFGIIAESAFREMDERYRSPFATGYRVLFSRSSIVDAVLERKIMPRQTPVVAPDNFESLVNQFWFKGMLSVQKAMRNDLLIALHLALDMVRDCLVLAMLLRDRAEGKNYHRTGGAYNFVATQLESTQCPHTIEGILASVEQSSIEFDRLAEEWSATYQAHRYPLLEWIDYARQQQVIAA